MYRVIHQIEIYLVDSAMQPFNDQQVYILHPKGCNYLWHGKVCQRFCVIDQVDHAFIEWIGRA